MQSPPICAIMTHIKTLGRCDYLLFLFCVLLLFCREAVVKRPPDYFILVSVIYTPALVSIDESIARLWALSPL